MMRVLAKAGLVCVLAVMACACARRHPAQNTEALQSWTKRCAVEPDDVSGLEGVATSFGLKAFSPVEAAALKRRIAAEQTVDPRRPPFVSMLEAWWIDREAGSYVEIAEWRTTSDGTTSIDSTTHRACRAQGTSDSGEKFLQDVRLDPAADYAVRTSRDKTTASMETSDGATPVLSVRFVKDGVRREMRPDGPAANNVSLTMSLAHISRTVGWPARWSFAASTEVH